MKKNYVPCKLRYLPLFLIFLILSGCSGTMGLTSVPGDEVTLLGKIVSTDGNVLTLAMAGEDNFSESSSLLVFDGGEKEITITNNTVFTDGLTLPDLQSEDILELTFSVGANGFESLKSVKRLENSMQDPGLPSIIGTAVYEQVGGEAKKTQQTVEAPSENQSAVKISEGGSFSLSDSSIITSGKTTSEDESRFYGLNSAILCQGGSAVALKNLSISTRGNGAAAIFAYGKSSTVTLADTEIKTTGTIAPGLSSTHNGSISATNTTIDTKGQRSPAVMIGRKGGAIGLTNVTAATMGTDSPALYSSGELSASGCSLSSDSSAAAVLNGKSSLTLTDTLLSGGSVSGVLLYREGTGSEEEISSLSMVGGSLVSKNGPLFYVTNTNAEIYMKGVSLSNISGIFLQASKGEWGEAGKNGGHTVLIADTQSLVGNITADKISSVSLTLKNTSAFTGALNTENTAAAMELSLDSTSIWNVTGTSYLTGLSNEDITFANIQDNGHIIYYDTKSGKNTWMGGKTIALNGGGKLTPAIA